LLFALAGDWGLAFNLVTDRSLYAEQRRANTPHSTTASMEQTADMLIADFEKET
jgi:hypothetical protein